jgi:hypothetical protein
MPWVRIDENAMDHPKFLALTDGAWRLWCEGQAYCQKHLTDGCIPFAALKGFRYYSPSRLKNLLQTNVHGKAACWTQSENGDIVVHDYLDWNDSRAEVLQARQMGRERRRKYRERHASLDADETANVSCGVGSSSLPSSSSSTEEGLGETEARAGAFCQWYEDRHQEVFGVGYMGSNNDYTTALKLVRKFTDQQLQNAALVWYGMDDDFATNGTRTVPKFASRITACLQLMKEHGIAS